MAQELVRVRPAERRDCPILIDLKKESAIHQGREGKPMLSWQELERDGFDTVPPCFHCIVAEVPIDEESSGPPSTSKSSEEEYKVVGFALYFFAYAAWEGKVLHLEDLSTSKSYRGKGLGTLLLKSLAKVGVEENCARIQLEVLDWNEVALKCYNRNGGVDTTKEEGWHNYKFNREAIRKLASS